MSTLPERRLHLGGDAIRAYSRRGNYHSEPAVAAAAGLPGLVAQGVQVAGPAYGALLAEWGDEFLDHGELDLRFVGLTMEDDDVRATVTVDGDDARLEVDNTTRNHVAVVGTARRDTRQLPPSVVDVSA